MAEGLARLEEVLDQMVLTVRDVSRVTGKALGQLGKEEVLRQAKVVFGADRKFSGSKRSRNARRPAGVSSYKITADGVTIYPSGDPWYIMVLGRGRSNIRPQGRALRTPFGPKASVHGGAFAGRPQVLDPIVVAIGERAPDVMLDAILQKLDEL